MSTSSAVPADLEAYGSRATELDGELREAAARLSMALGAFLATAPEYGANLPDVDLRTAALAASSGELDAWVGRVGHAFDEADRRPADRLAKVNDRVLARQLERDDRRDGEPLEQRYAETRQQIQDAWAAALAELDSASGDKRARLVKRITTLESFLAPGPDGKPRQFLFFDPRGDGRVAEVFGDLAAAGAVAVVVPGMGSDLDNFRTTASNARALQNQAGGGAATIAWLGYDAPNDWRDPRGVWDAAHDGTAKQAAFSLVDFMQGLHLRDDVRTTVIGHSYGSLVLGEALRDGLHVDNAVVIGSPGIGVDHLDELHLAKDTHFYAGKAVLDPIPYSERFGRDPADARFGAISFDTGRDKNRNLVEFHNANGYFAEGSDSLRNIAHITDGDYADVTTRGHNFGEQAAAVYDRGRRAVNDVVHDAEHGAEELRAGVDSRIDRAQGDADRYLGPLGPAFDADVDSAQSAFDAGVDAAKTAANAGLRVAETPLDLAAGAVDRGDDLAHDVWHALSG